MWGQKHSLNVWNTHTPAVLASRLVTLLEMLSTDLYPDGTYPILSSSIADLNGLPSPGQKGWTLLKDSGKFTNNVDFSTSWCQFNELGLDSSTH